MEHTININEDNNKIKNDSSDNENEILIKKQKKAADNITIFVDLTTPGQTKFPIQETYKKEKVKKDIYAILEEQIYDFMRQFTRPSVYIEGVQGFLVLFSFTIGYSLLISDKSSNEQYLVNEMKNELLSVILSSCIIGPFLEEFIFRKLLFGITKKFSLIFAYLLSSFIFAFGHFQYSFSVLLLEMRTFPPYFFAGLVFAYVYNYEESLLAPIIMHVLNNTVSTILALISI